MPLFCQFYGGYIMPNKSDLLAQYKQMAKTANQRLLRIEQRAAKGDTRALDYAYRVAQKDIRDYRGSGKSRYNTVAPESESISQIQARIADVEKFLNMPTSTAKGLKSIDQQRVDSLNESTGSDLTVSDMTRLSQSGMLDKLKSDYGSKQLFKALGSIKRNINKLSDQIKQHRKRDISTDIDDPLEADIVDSMLGSRKYGSKLIDLLR